MMYHHAEIEAKARAMRAEATRKWVRALGRWIVARHALLTHPRARAQHG